MKEEQQYVEIRMIIRLWQFKAFEALKFWFYLIAQKE